MVSLQEVPCRATCSPRGTSLEGETKSERRRKVVTARGGRSKGEKNSPHHRSRSSGITSKGMGEQRFAKWCRDFGAAVALANQENPQGLGGTQGREKKGMRERGEKGATSLPGEVGRRKLL